MKKAIYLIIGLAFLIFTDANCQKPSIELTFTANYQAQYVMLDSIYIQNLTQPDDTMLYAPDTVLLLDYIIGLPDHQYAGKSSFSVSPNYPNPSVDGKTSIDVFIPVKETVTIRIADLAGRVVVNYENTLDAGTHHFTFYAGMEKCYVLWVACSNEIRSVKIMNSGNGGQAGEKLVYQGMDEPSMPLKSQNKLSGFTFSLGDQLQYTAYAEGYQENIMIDIPETSETYTFEMLPSGFVCGSSITINHVTGDVAPVNKTVTYGTVTNIPGEPSKCWITSNLGADHQATAVNDATEASAGWYWQFNRKQGYKHTGTVRTPNTPWINIIDEDFDWQAANDPCNLELGSGWRLPTYIEWYNVDAGGNWTNKIGPWNSALKMHAAGYLDDWYGSLTNRGVEGSSWSSMQNDANHGGWLYFNSDICHMSNSSKAYGFSARCLREPSTSTIPTVSTSPVLDITQTTATGGGEVTDDGGAEVTARGVCWSIYQNPTIADSHTSDGTGTGVFVSNLTSLTPNTPYYVRAYATNSVGTAYGNEVNFTTLSAGFTCGSSITINHVTGEVVPVNKTVTYGTVTNIPGEETKCWITSNLGADHQATAVSDATEASAGWYWQFNRKQGYKHTGTVRTPNTPWIYPIEEDFDWQAANDPCALELGSGWRLPTYLEWYNVDAIGNWTNWNGPWNSALKMHAAGALNQGDGSLSDRGSSGVYWCSTQVPTSIGYYLHFGNTYSDVPGNIGKANATPLRCLREPNTAVLPTVITAGITDITPTSAIGGGEVTNDGGASITARGVCWSILPNPTTADSFTFDDWGTGAFVSNLTDLIPGTPYYVRSYATNFIGTAYGNEVTFTTLPFSFICGTPIIINHVTGDVVPVNKTVTYGTVNNIPGEPSKCWITSNLGADNQATAKNDATEPSAGWYWQFNRKQGYKHTGSVRTPNTPWISSIDEDYDWQAVNDPCTIELGSGWRIPTNTEWTNVNVAGNWTNWNGPWNSALKMHAAGSLYFPNGSLVNRGSIGLYWSNTQAFTTDGYRLYFSSTEINIGNEDKPAGLSIRCLAYASASVIPTVSTSEVVDITQTTSTGGGEVTSDGGAEVTARGVCWSTSQNPTIADSHTSDGTGTGTFVSNLTGLTPNTPYFARAYATNSVGTAYGNEVNFITLSGSFTCGNSLTINHVTGEVAPVDKTVTYGTVTNIPGEPSKCWITSNLGADHQATAVSDATEPSAGWYWQFNRKQGYKHTGTVRTPNTTWISSINENSNWITANDPCALELGDGWRIPTKIEWTNVYAAGDWTTWDGPWNSALKVHAAGYLTWSNGLLYERGNNGVYRSSTQYGIADLAWSLYFGDSWCMIAFDWGKSWGLSVRCVRDASASTIPIVSTSPVIEITQTTATSGGNVTADGGANVTARGVCWSTSQNPTTADSHTSDGTGTGMFISNLTSLTPNTPYYVRAYATNSVGTAYGNEVTFTTLSAGFTCGSSITINHVTGDVAPVDKTVTYGTVNNIPGEPSKCWITSNLGADHQATAVSDATEESAGWYWQFNRKQGYKHTGTVRTPNTPWITSIDEDFDWLAANDPCALELGAGWRIPTNTEWTNVETSGNWTNWNGPWNSALKLHAAGNLTHSNGSVYERGSFGIYWSSMQYSAEGGWDLFFYSEGSETQDYGKANANTARCIKE